MIDKRINGSLTKEQLVKQFRRSEIIKAARTVFAKHGYQKATIDMIAAHAGIAKGTVYFYFNNKEAIFLQALEESAKKLLQNLSDIVQEKVDPITRIKKSVLYFFEFIEDDKDFYCIFHTVILECQLRELASHMQKVQGFIHNYYSIIAPTLKEAIDSGILLKMDPLKMAYIFSGIIESFVHYNIVNNITEPFSNDAELAFKLFFNAFSTKQRKE
jgi:AcrR family transcriptional regulator